MPIARRFAVALAVTGVGVLAYAIPASATNGKHHNTPPAGCVDGTRGQNLKTDVRIDTAAGTATATAKVKAGKELCAPVQLYLSNYKVPKTWDGKGWNSSAAPQTETESVKGTVHDDSTLTLTVKLVPCGAGQVDLYFPPKISYVTFPEGHGRAFLGGGLYSTGKKECSPTPPTTTAAPTTTPPRTTTAPPTTRPATTAPPTTRPATTTVPETSPATTRPAAVPPVVRVTPTAPAVAAPGEQELASTGSNSTIPMLSLGGVLLAAGIGLSIAGRKRESE